MQWDNSFALANVQIPASLGPGNYIMKYLWGKYADCVDIAVLPPKPNGDPAISAPLHSESGDYARHAWIDTRDCASRGNLVCVDRYEWLRIDHCQYVRRTLGTKAMGETLASSAAKVQQTYASVPLDEVTGLMQSSAGDEEKITLQAACVAIPPPGNLSSLNFDDEKALELCQARATKVGAEGINVVPMDPPPRVQLSVDDPSTPSVYYNGDPASANVAGGMNIPWGIGNCDRKYFANEPPGTKICYPIVVYGNRENAEQKQQVELTDTEDEVWYSTCYQRSFKRSFSVECGAQCKPSVAKEWRFGDSCISCADAIRNADFRVVPHWKLASPASCRACWAPISDAPPLLLPPADQPENGWISPDGSLSITYTRTAGTTDSVTFVVTCTICTNGGWLAMGPSPNNGMVGTNAVRWRFAEVDGVDEVRIAAKSTSGFTVITPGNLNRVETIAASGKAKTLTFSTSKIGEHSIPGYGNQNWAWAFSTGAGFTQHTGGDMGIMALSFTLDPPPVPAPTAPPIFDPSEGGHSSNEPEPDPTFSPTLAPSLLQPDANRPRIEATVTLNGCAVTSFTDGSVLWKSFVSVLAAKMSLEDKDVIVIRTKAATGLATPARRRLGVGESETGMSASVEFAIIGYTSQTPTDLISTLKPFLADKSGAGFEFLLQDKLFGTKYQLVTVGAATAPTIVMSAQAASGGAEGVSTDDTGVTVALSLGAVAMLCIALVGAVAAVFVVVVVIQRKRQNASIKAAAKLQPQDQQMGGIVAVSTFNPYSAAMKQVEMRDMIGFAPPADEPPPPMMESDDGGGNDDTCTFAPSVDLLPPPEIVMKGRSNPNRAPKIPKGTRLPVAEL